MGGDHSIVLPILRSLKTVYGPISVIHLDSHLDTWDPYEGYTGIASEQSAITHGTFFWHASREGCIAKGTSVHGGLRTKLFVRLPRFPSPIIPARLFRSVAFMPHIAFADIEVGSQRLRDRQRYSRLHHNRSPRNRRHRHERHH